jgi:glycosyltransferase involved in cell wall biosynthesis
MQKIKVLHLIKTLSLGGAELNLYNLIQTFNTDRFEIHIGYSWGGSFEEKFRKSRIKIFKFSEGNYRIKSFSSFIILWRLIKYIKRNKIQIIHTHSFNTHFWGSIAAKIMKIRIVEHVHDSRYLEPAEFKRRRETCRQYRYIKYFKNISDRVIVLTKQNVEFLFNNRLYTKEQVRKIQNGISVCTQVKISKKRQKTLRGKWNISNDNLIVLTNCRISPEKNIDLIFSVAPIVKRACPKVIFIIAGDGPSLEKFRSLSRERRLEKIIKLPGFCSQVYELLSISDIFLLPSFLELHSLALLEAMRMEIPIITSRDVGCNNEFIDNWNNGILLDPFSPEEWAEAIIKLLKDIRLRRVIGHRGYQLCKRQFNINDVARKIEGIYIELVGD